MAFLFAVASRFPPLNNQLRTSPNPRNQATIQDGRVTVQGRQTQSFADTGNRGIATTSRGNYAAGQAKFYNCSGEGHMAKNALSQRGQEILHGSRRNLDAYDSDCDDISSSKAVLMANLSGQAFWLKHLNYNPDTPVKSHTPIRIEAPSELPKVSLVNESLKKLKYQLASFDKVVKKRTTSDAISAGAWGFKHTKACFVTEIVQFLKVLKDTFNAFDKTFLDEITEVQTVFNQMEAAIDQCSVDKNAFEIQIKQPSIDNDQLLKQFMSQEIVHIDVNSVDILDVNKSCMDQCNKCIELKIKLIKKKDLIEKYVYDKLSKSYSTLEKHCISLELANQLNKEIFQKDNFCENQNAPTFNRLFEINELKDQSQEKVTVIRKLKDRIKSLSGKDSVENVKKYIDVIETINIELKHSVAKLLYENENLRKEREHLKSIYKDQFDSIRKTRVQSKEHYDSLIAQINAKSVENSNLNAQLQEMVFAIATLKNKFRKLKGKNVVNTTVSKPIIAIVPGMFNLDIEPISHRLKNNRDAHEVYLEKTIENTDTLCRLVECARKQNPSEPLLESACMFTKHVQELLVYVSKTCPRLMKHCEKLVVVTPMNKDKKVRFVKPVISSSNIPKQIDSLKTKDSNKPLLTSTGVNTATSASGSKPSCNIKKHSISRPPSNNQKNKVEEHHRKVKSSLIKTNSVYEPISIVHVKHCVRNAKFESICAICNNCLFDANHDMLWRLSNGNVTTSWFYYVEGLGHNLFSMGQFCDSDLEVAFHKHICFIQDLEGVDLLKGSRVSNLYTLSMEIFLLSSPICLFSKASKTKSWLWHQRLSHLNFNYITSLAKEGLVQGLPKLKYQKDHLCSACALGKSKKHSHKPKAEDFSQEKLYLLHMDLYGPMRIQSINGRKYILVTVDDYSQFT
ncbi:retrovirus-related pol polyprotein from transposon TNT 1-94 [Tanacetum coccineum]|uniref:Retrovirus-related pol polyprotein from transposon TNT 1-94 n=1 Tax=Tanacetum coccineum TaxID=301880 RepID=A0ABQ5FN55_9ASTR